MFSYVQNLKSSKTGTITPDFFLTVLNSTIVRENCNEIALALVDRKKGIISSKKFEETKRKYKEKLPAFLFHGNRSCFHISKKSGVDSYSIGCRFLMEPNELRKMMQP